MTMTVASVGPQRYQERYAARREAVQQARRDMALALESWRLPQLVEAAEQIVTELVANAVEHTNAATVGASLTRTGQEAVRIVVTDTSRNRPTLAAPASDDENGRGLLLVDALAHDWGSELVHGGKRVWAELRGDGVQ
ncbi:ATP-binding protein [Streptomyces sioyaensis]|uniref:ATP-binding protein n=1 Tax=Streptomyces sioyaensis TaxID=67364 RepID=UPI0037955843